MAPKSFDPTLKALVEAAPGDWPALLGYPLGPTEAIDADIATVSGAGDKVLRIRASPPYLLHLEFQSGHDSASLPRLLHFRNTLLGNRHRLHVRSAAVLLRPETDSPTLTRELRLAFPGEEPYLVFRYGVVRVWQLPPNEILRGGLGTLPLAPISAVTEADLPGIIERIEARLRTRHLRPFADEIWSATLILLGLRYSQEFAKHLLQGVRSMKESVTYQAILEEGAEQGAIREARKILLRQGRLRFGRPTARISAALEGLSDINRLEQLGEDLLQASSWEELLGPAKQRPPARRRRAKE